jgi:tetratricopeptide (TPR) repeat protein
VERLLAHDPADPAYRNLMAACLGLVGENDRVITIYEALLKTYDKQPGLWLNYGHALRTVGRRADAVAAYNRCITLSPGHGEAYWSLANLKVTSFSLDDEAAMAREAARTDLSDDDRLHLHYALGKALEDRGAFSESFSHYAKGAEIRRAQSSYDSDETTAFTRRSIALFTQAFFDARAGAGSPSPAPIFIVGLPRAGSTLIEQILASHSAVEGTMELPDVNLIAKSLAPADAAPHAAPYPEILAGFDPGQFAALGERFLADTQIHRKLGRPFFIDKMPNNFQHVGLIHLMLPNAKIIDARRHPMGSCFSAFKQHFNQGQSFSYDLRDLALYYRDYVALMRHIDAVLPGRVHRVIYEDMVENTDREIRRLLDYCGLPFEAACLKFYDNDRAVRTVSSEQVRRPIFRDGLEQWRRFEPWLTPLEQALGDVLHTWR